MTRKNYNELADSLAFLLRITANEDERRGVIETIKVVATTLKSDNRAFDKERFFTACGI